MYPCLDRWLLLYKSTRNASLFWIRLTGDFATFDRSISWCRRQGLRGRTSSHHEVILEVVQFGFLPAGSRSRQTGIGYQSASFGASTATGGSGQLDWSLFASLKWKDAIRFFCHFKDARRWSSQTVNINSNWSSWLKREKATCGIMEPGSLWVWMAWHKGWCVDEVCGLYHY